MEFERFEQMNNEIVKYCKGRECRATSPDECPLWDEADCHFENHEIEYGYSQEPYTHQIENNYKTLFGKLYSSETYENSESNEVSTTTPTIEVVNHPAHYAHGDIECIDAMYSAFGVDAVAHFCLLNAFKYIWRAEHKNGIEDISKAEWYLNKYKEVTPNR